MSSTYSIGEAKTQLSKLVRQAEEGEEVILRRGSIPVARLVPLTRAGEAIKRAPGRMRGRVSVPEDYDEWPEDVARALGLSPRCRLA
jgi:prevent-host-death family protein